jgi:hypothetical protein
VINADPPACTGFWQRWPTIRGPFAAPVFSRQPAVVTAGAWVDQ